MRTHGYVRHDGTLLDANFQALEELGVGPRDEVTIVVHVVCNKKGQLVITGTWTREKA